MRLKKQKLLSSILAVSMLFSSVPSVFAAEEAGDTAPSLTAEFVIDEAEKDAENNAADADEADVLSVPDDEQDSETTQPPNIPEEGNEKEEPGAPDGKDEAVEDAAETPEPDSSNEDPLPPAIIPEKQDAVEDSVISEHPHSGPETMCCDHPLYMNEFVHEDEFQPFGIMLLATQRTITALHPHNSNYNESLCFDMIHNNHLNANGDIWHKTYAYVDDSGKFVYCTEPQVGDVTGTRSGESTLAAYLKQKFPGHSDAQINDLVNRLTLQIYYAERYFGSSVADKGKSWALGQNLTWRTLTGHGAGTNYSDTCYVIYNSNVSQMVADENAVITKVNAYLKHTSINGKTYSMLGDKTLEVTDSNGVLKDFVVKSAGKGVTASISGNTLKIDAKNSASGTIDIVLEKKLDNTDSNEGVGTAIVFTDPHFQDVFNGDCTRLKETIHVNVTSTGYLTLQKTSSDPDAMANSEYSLEGAVYSIYKDAACTDYYTNLTTRADGTTRVAYVYTGTYYVKETTAPKGFLPDNNVYKVTVTGDHTELKPCIMHVSETPKNGNLYLTKVSALPEFTEGNSCYSLEGAEYGVYADAACEALVKTMKTDANGEASCEGLLLGAYYVKEITPSKGYELDPEIYTVNISDNGNAKIDIFVTSTETPLDDPLGFAVQKTNSGSSFADPKELAAAGEPTLAGAEFTVNYYAGEAAASARPDRTWTFRADENFRITINKAHLVAGDELFINAGGQVVFPLGTITIQETKAPDGYMLDDTVFTGHVRQISGTEARFELDETDYSRFIIGHEPDGTMKLGIINTPVPIIHTTASDSVTGTHLGRLVKDASIIDKVEIEHLVKGQSYKVRGTVYDAATGSPVVTTDGMAVTGSAEFTADSATATVDVNFDFNASSLFGKTVVICEELYDSDNTLLATHTDLDDAAQKVYYPSIKTVALSTATGLHLGITDVLSSLADTITLGNMYYSGETFRVKGWLVDKATGETIKDKNGAEAVYETMITPNEDGGLHDILTLRPVYNYDASDLAGSQIVVFEEVYLGDDLIIAHCDIADKEQTVRHPSLDTTALDHQTSTHTGVITKDAVVVDTVTYTNLIPGEEYRISGIFKDSKTGATVVDGKGTAITAEKTFVPTEAGGSVEVIYEFDSTGLAGRSVTLFEELYLGENKIVFHTDLEDADQMISFPDMHTFAKDGNTQDQVAAAAPNCVIVDTIEYEGLDTTKTYTAKGSLLNAATGEPVRDADGDYVIAETSFIPASSDGEAEVVFRFDASNLQNTTVVVSEELLEENVLIMVHADLEDKDQTVYFPGLFTTAKNLDTNTQNGAASDAQTIVDTVHYQNLVVGKQYTVSGVLMNKATGEPIADHDGKDITASVTFTAKRSDGTVDLVYSLDASLLQGETVVVFEDIYHNNIEVAFHEDLTDEDQSVFYPIIRTTALDASGVLTDDDGNEIYNGATGTHTGVVRKDAVITDKVTYENLLKNTEYTVSGILMDKQTGKPVLANADQSMMVLSVRVAAPGLSVVLKADGTEPVSALSDDNCLAVIQDVKDGVYTVSVEENEITIVIKDGVVYAEDGESAVPETNVLVSVVCGVIKQTHGEPVTSSATFVTGDNEDGMTVSGSLDLTYVLDSRLLKGCDTVVFEKLYLHGVLIVSHDVITDEDQTIHYPEIKTTALDKETGTHTLTLGETVVLTDTVAYQNLEPGVSYSLRGTVMVKETGAVFTDADGNPVTADLDFVPDSRNGSVELEFMVDSTMLAGNTLVVYEVLSENGIVVNRHEDINDVDQSLACIELHTTASDATTGGHEGEISEAAMIIDIVEYKNLIPGKEYTVSGVLMKKTVTDEGVEAEPLLDADGELIYGQLVGTDGEPVEGNRFVSDTRDGELKLVYNIDSTLLKGENVVVFEDMYHEDILVASHADIEDEDQTIHYPVIGTQAHDAVSLTGQGVVDGETVKIVDVVSYSNVLPGSYIMRGCLMNKETGEAVTGEDGETLIVSAPLVITSADEMSGEMEMVFIVEAEKAEGADLVVFEKLFLDEKEIVNHEDIEDEGQTVEYVKIHTTAMDQAIGDNDHVGKADEKTVIVDTVFYENVIPGQEYTVKGVLMEKESGKPLLDHDGKEIAAEAVFTAEETSGSVDLVYEFDSSLLAGKTVVVFEDLYRDDLLIVSHADITDEDQSVHFPELQTEATVGGKHQTEASEKTTLIDVVDYTNLVIGKEYKIRGVLMDKATGKPILVDGKEVVSEATFVAEAESGQIEMTFVFNSLYATGTIIVFETLYKDSKEVAVHADLTDEKQSVIVTEPPKEVPPTKTGDPGIPAALFGAFSIALAGAAGGFALKKKRKDAEE